MRFDEQWYSVEDRGHETHCWIWKRALTPAGYGSAWCPKRHSSASAHVLVYEQEIGPFPEGMWADHLCRVRACVNPEHIELVPPSLNIRRGTVGKLRPEQYEEMVRLFEEGTSLDTLCLLYPEIKRKTIKYHLGLLSYNLPPRLRHGVT